MPDWQQQHSTIQKLTLSTQIRISTDSTDSQYSDINFDKLYKLI